MALNIKKLFPVDYCQGAGKPARVEGVGESAPGTPSSPLGQGGQEERPTRGGDTLWRRCLRHLDIIS